jgi:signal peptidase I
MESAEDTEAPSVGPPLAARVRRYVLTTVLCALALVMLAFLLYVKPYRVSSGSMAPTAMVGQRLLADHLHDDSWNPKVGDVIVFKAPGGARDEADDECGIPRIAGTACLSPIPGRTDISFVKRVVGTPGDRLQIAGGHVIRNGVAANESFARSCDDEICNLAPFIVPAGDYFVMGDNRGDSDDSRYWGPVPRAQIIGHVFGSYWPLKRLGRL